MTHCIKYGIFGAFHQIRAFLKVLGALVPEHLQSLLMMAIDLASLPNGTHDPMSLTLYSANPDEKCEKTPASASIPPEYLLSSGHPDVCEL